MSEAAPDREALREHFDLVEGDVGRLAESIQRDITAMHDTDQPTRFDEKALGEAGHLLRVGFDALREAVGNGA